MPDDHTIIDLEVEQVTPLPQPGQLVLQTFAGDMVIAADGLGGVIPEIVNDVLGREETRSDPDSVSGALLASLAANPQCAQTLQVGTTVSRGTGYTLWLRHHHHDTWWIAEGMNPDTLEWSTWRKPA